MKIAVSGSIAEDYLMTFPGRFSEVIVPEEIENLSLSFLVDDLEVQRGGVAANICFGMGMLGLRPLLVGAVGADFRLSYERWLTDHGVDTSGVHVSDERHTARFLCTTDESENQIASFYPGAMSEAGDLDLTEIVASNGGVDLVMISPNDPAAMLRHRREADAVGAGVVADPSQQLPRLEPDQVRTLVDGAAYLVANEYEAGLIDSLTGWSPDELLERVGTRITTRSEKGSLIEQQGQPAIEVPAVSTSQAVDPTGVGDAYRAGLFAGLAEDLDLERAAQLGAVIAVHAVEVPGPQRYRLDPEATQERFTQAYGTDAAADVSPILERLARSTAAAEHA